MLFIWLVSLTATLGSLYFSEVRHYVPCEMCWYQRILMYPIVIISTIAIIQKNAKAALTVVVFSIIGSGLAMYHYGIQKIKILTENAPSCGEVSCTGQYINWFGFITIPFLSLVAFLLITATAIYVLKSLKSAR